MGLFNAQFRWSLDIECPKCEGEINLLDQDEDGCFSKPIFNNRWDDLKDTTVICPECGFEFTIDGVDY